MYRALAHVRRSSLLEEETNCRLYFDENLIAYLVPTRPLKSGEELVIGTVAGSFVSFFSSGNQEEKKEKEEKKEQDEFDGMIRHNILKITEKWSSKRDEFAKFLKENPTSLPMTYIG